MKVSELLKVLDLHQQYIAFCTPGINQYALYHKHTEKAQNSTAAKYEFRSWLDKEVINVAIKNERTWEVYTDTVPQQK